MAKKHLYLSKIASKNMAHRYLVGENVRLRNVEAADVDFLCEIENDSQNWNVSDTLAPYSRTTMEEYIQRFKIEKNAESGFCPRYVHNLKTDCAWEIE